MSTDRLTEILNHLSAMSRDSGEFRQEFRQFREETNARFEKVEEQLETLRSEQQTLRSEQRQMSQLLNRVVGSLFTFRADVDELQDRVTKLERKGA